MIKNIPCFCGRRVNLRLRFNQHRISEEFCTPIYESGHWNGDCRCGERYSLLIEGHEVQAMKPKPFFLNQIQPTDQQIAEKETMLKESQKNLDQTVREGRAHGRNINNLRSKMKNGKWTYQYIK